MVLALDIETVPLEAAMARPYPADDRPPPGNYKDPEAIAKWRAADEAKWADERVKAYSLSPLTGRLVAVGMADEDSPWCWLAREELDEARLVSKVLDRMTQAYPLVTWNGLGFDLPFLFTRAAILGVPRPPGFAASAYLKRYTVEPHCDLKASLAQWDQQKMRASTLDDWAAAFGLGGKGGHGSEVYTMHREGRHADLAAYAADDARLTLALYERCLGYFA